MLLLLLLLLLLKRPKFEFSAAATEVFDGLLAPFVSAVFTVSVVVFDEAEVEDDEVLAFGVELAEF